MRFLKIKFKVYGFTLIELLVVVSIIAILAAIGLAVFSGTNSRARDSKRKSDISSISNALESTYDASKGSYSDFTEQSVVEKMFASNIPQPSRSGDYSYYTNTDKNAFVVCTALEVKSDASSQCSPLSDPALCYCIKSRQGDASNFFVLSNGSITNNASVNRYPNPNFTSPTPIPNFTYIPPASENGSSNTPTPTQAITNTPAPTPTFTPTPTIASTPVPTPIPVLYTKDAGQINNNDLNVYFDNFSRLQSVTIYRNSSLVGALQLCNWGNGQVVAAIQDTGSGNPSFTNLNISYGAAYKLFWCQGGDATGSEGKACGNNMNNQNLVCTSPGNAYTYSKIESYGNK